VVTGGTSVAYVPSTAYEVQFDFLGKNNSDWFRESTFTTELWAGTPGSGVLLGSNVQTAAAGQDTTTTITFTTTATSLGSGNLFLRFDAAVPSVDGFRQAFIDNVAITAIPEPSTYAAIAAVGALGLALWRRRRS
jgi:hypothetical protein